jgi:hypothetical protein
LQYHILLNLVEDLKQKLIAELKKNLPHTIILRSRLLLQYHILLNLVEDLKQKLIAERKKNLTLEANVREELCQVLRPVHFCRIGSGIV